MSKNSISSCALLLVLVAGVALAAEVPPSSPATGCQTAAITAGNAHDQIIQLSKVLDPSGKLSKMIADYHPAHANGAHAHADPMQVAASEIDQVKREVDQAAANSTSEAVTTTTTAMPTSSSSDPQASSTLATLIMSTSSSSSSSSNSTTEVPVVKSAVEVNATTLAPTVKATEASNVTVNVFLQLVPDAKTDELINNPDAASSTTPAPANSSQAAAPSSESPSSTSTQASAQVPSSTTAAPPVVVSSTVAAPTPGVASGAAAEPSKPTSRRRRRWATVPAAATVATVSSTTVAPSTAAPVSTTTTTTTTTAAPVTQAATTTTTTTTTPAPSSTTTTTTSAPSTTTSTTTTAAPSTTAAPPKSTTTSTQATVELSARDLAMAADTPIKSTMVEMPIEIVVSAVPQAPSAASAASEPIAAAPTTTTTTTTTTTAAPSTTSTTTTAPVVASSTQAPVSSSTTSAPPAPTTTTTTTSPSTTSTSSTTTTTTQVPSVAPQKASSAAAAGMQLDNNFNGGGGEAQKSERILTNQKESTRRLVDTVEVKRETHDLTKQQQVDRTSDNLALDNLNVIYDNDNEHVELQSGQQQSSSSTVGNESPSAGKQQQQQHGHDKKVESSFVHSEHADELPQEPQDNYATCLLEQQLVVDNQVVVSNLTGRLNFWQPIENRGILHLIARLRYSQATTTTTNAGRLKRESFQTLIERLPAGAPVGTRRALRQHQIWVLDECGQQQQQQQQRQSRKLLAELKADPIVTQQQLSVVDIDAELTVGQFNLTEPNTILNRCLQLSFQDNSGEVLLATCKIQSSHNLPAVSELDHLPSVSAVQPIREDLLQSSASSPSPTPTSLSSSTPAEENSGRPSI